MQIHLEPFEFVIRKYVEAGIVIPAVYMPATGVVMWVFFYPSFQTIVAQQGFVTLLYREQKNNKKYSSSLNQSLTDTKGVGDHKDKDRCGCSDVASNVKMNMRQTYIVIFYLLSCFLTKGQEIKSDKLKNLFENNFVATGDFQFLKCQSASLGLGFAHVPEHCDLTGKGIILNNEFVFKNSNQDFIYSPQILAFYSPTKFIDKFPITFYLGSKFSYYTNFKNGGNFCFTPEVGLGYYVIFLTYSRNINITNNDLIPINKDNISIKIQFPIMILF